MGHKSVRQLYFIEDEMDAVDVYNRLRSHLLMEYSLKFNPAFPSSRGREAYDGSFPGKLGWTGRPRTKTVPGR